MAIKIENKLDCCGCKACQDVCPCDAISFFDDLEGFWYPTINKEKCISCNKCEQVCPQLTSLIHSEPLKVYAARYEKKDVLLQSSSGGIFTALATEVIEKEKGHVYCVQYDQNIVAKFQKIESIEALAVCRGSKYVQADTDGIYNEILADLKKDIYVMFVGTPCQASAVREVTKKYKNRILIVDFICHGVPSPMLFSDYVHYLEQKRHSKVKKYNNRSKAEGWKHLEEIIYENGRVDHESSLSQAWRNMFYTHNCLRPSCYGCRYNHYQNRKSDITIADFWGIEQYHPQFANPDGNSVVIEYTDVGRYWFNRISSNINYIPSQLENCLGRQPHFRGEAAVPSNREEFWSDYYKYGISYLTRKYGKCGLNLRVKKLIKRLIRLNR